MRVSRTLWSSPRDLFIHLFIPGLNLNTVDVGGSHQRCEDSCLWPPLSPFPLTVHPAGGGQMDEKAAISSDIILERRKEWGEIRGVGGK